MGWMGKAEHPAGKQRDPEGSAGASFPLHRQLCDTNQRWGTNQGGRQDERGVGVLGAMPEHKAAAGDPALSAPTSGHTEKGFTGSQSRFPLTASHSS